MAAPQAVPSLEQTTDEPLGPAAAAISTAGWIVSAVLAAGFLIAIGVLAHQENGGPPHATLELAGGEPATIYFPGATGTMIYEHIPLVPPPAESRPAGVVLVHGHSADRNSVSRIARQLATNGYVVLAVEVHGHGANRNPFRESFGSSGPELLGDVKNGVDFLRTSPFVNPARIIVMGHSMGAGAALDYAATDKDLAGAVMISGGFDLYGPERPHNALFIFAQRDPGFIRMLSSDIAGHLIGADKPELGKRYGTFEAGNAVEAVEVPGVDHVQILSSDAASKTIIEWADGATGNKRTSAIDLRDPRRMTSTIALLLFACLLVPMGRMTATFAPRWDRAEGTGWLGLVAVAAALAAAMPLVAMARPASFLGIEVGSELFSWLAVAGIIMLFVMAARTRLDWRKIGTGAGQVMLAAAMSFALIYAANGAMAATTHSLTLTPERALTMLFSTMLAFPFFLAFEMLVRRGGTTASTVTGALGRIVLLAMMFVAMAFDVLPFVLGLLIILFVITFITIEIFAASVYSVSRNLLLIAVVESAWLAWIISAWMPIKFMI
jgi:dienelactone hydrolase